MSKVELEFYEDCAKREGISLKQWLKQMNNGEF